MKKIANELILEFRRTKFQGTGLKILDAIDNGTPVDGTLLIASSGNAYKLYLDAIEKRCEVGNLERILKESQETVSQDVAKILATNSYSIELGSRVDGTDSTYTVFLREYEVEQGQVVLDDVFDSEIERITAAGICTREELQERILVMKENDLVDADILNVLTRYYQPIITDSAETRRDIRRPKTIYVSPYKESPIKHAIMNLMDGNCIIFDGPKSTGKNACGETVGWLMNLPVCMDTYGEDMISEDAFGGNTMATPEIILTPKEELEEMAECWFMAMNARGSELTSEQLRKAARYDVIKARATAPQIAPQVTELVTALRFGFLYIANEMTNGTQNLLSKVFNQLADGTGWIFIPGYGKLDIHPNFGIIGTMNRGYEGTHEMNFATLSRFAVPIFENSDSIVKQLKQAVRSKTDSEIEETIYLQIDNLYQKVKKLVERGQVSNDMFLNIRGFVAALTTYANHKRSTSLKYEITEKVINLCSEEDRENLISEMDKAIA